MESKSAIGVLKNALGKCTSEADRSQSAIGVLRNALGSCKSEADRSQSAIGLLKIIGVELNVELSGWF